MTQKISRINAPEAAQGNPGHPYWKTSQYRASLTRAARREAVMRLTGWQDKIQLYQRSYIATYATSTKPIPWNALPRWVRDLEDERYVRHIEG